MEERKLWVELWGLPVAVVWEQWQNFRLVARYCKTVLLVEKGERGVAWAGEARQLEDRLGLSPRSSFYLNHVIVDEGGAHAVGEDTVANLEAYRKALGVE